jgi:hypothetical protein
MISPLFTKNLINLAVLAVALVLGRYFFARFSHFSHTLTHTERHRESPAGKKRAERDRRGVKKKRRKFFWKQGR